MLVTLERILVGHTAFAEPERRGRDTEVEAVEIDLRPRKNSNRLRHRSIIASDCPSSTKSFVNCSTVAVSPISVKSYADPSSARASSSAAWYAAARTAGS